MSTVTVAASALSSRATGRVTVTVTGAVVGETMTVWRDDLSGVLRPEMGGRNIPAASTVIDDPCVMLGRPTWWRVVTSTAVSAISPTPVTIAATLPVLSDPVMGDEVAVSIKDWPELSYAGRVTVIEVEGDPQRRILSDVESTPTSEPILWTATREELAAVRRILGRGRPVLLRATDRGVEDSWIQVTGRREQRITMRAADARRIHKLTVEHWADVPDLDQRAKGDTLGMLAVAVSPQTLGSIAATWATLGGIASADLG